MTKLKHNLTRIWIPSADTPAFATSTVASNYVSEATPRSMGLLKNLCSWSAR